VRRAVRVAATALALTSCSPLLVSQSPPEQVLWLTSPAVPASNTPARQERLRIDVSVAPGLDTESVLYLDPHGNLHRHPVLRWPDYPPELVSSLARRTLEDTGRYRAVLDGDRTSPTEAELGLEVRELFIAESLEGRVARLTVGWTWSCGAATTAMPARVYEAPEGGDGRPATWAQAFQTVFDAALRELAEASENGSC